MQQVCAVLKTRQALRHATTWPFATRWSLVGHIVFAFCVQPAAEQPFASILSWELPPQLLTHIGRLLPSTRLTS